MIHPLRISKPRLQDFFFSQGYDPGIVSLAKDFYYLPDRQWLDTDFAQLLAKAQARKYQEWSWICVDFARESANLAAELFASDPTSPHDGGLLFGETRCVLRVGGHGINATVFGSDNGETLALGFFDPQLRRVVSLTDAEGQACFAFWL